jgi:hypothetical protein
MKIAKLILFIISSLMILYGCSEKDEIISDEFQTEVDNNLRNKVKKKDWCKVFIVSPTNNDDTENIQNAFNSAVEAGPGSIVQFEAGTFYFSKPIIVANFNGIFRGAGMDKTIIKNKSEIIFPLMDTGPEAGFSGLFYFYSEGTGSKANICFLT